MDKMMTSIIIPIYILPDKNWELWDFTLNCLNSIKDHTAEPYELILVDNGSPIDSVRMHHLMGKAKIYIRNQTNLGFAPAVNQGLKIANGEFLVAINNDVTVLPGWLGLMTGAWLGHTGVICSHLHDHDPEHRVGRQSVQPGMMFGALWMTKRKVLDVVGYLDEGYERGMWEDADLFRRIAAKGFELAKVGWCHHIGNATWGKLPNQQEIYLKNKARFEAKWGKKL